MNITSCSASVATIGLTYQLILSATLANAFDPQLMILGGGLVTTEDLLLSPARESFKRFIFARAHRELPPLAPARLGTDAGLIGAALLALYEYPDPSTGGREEILLGATSATPQLSRRLIVAPMKLRISEIWRSCNYRSPVCAYATLGRSRQAGTLLLELDRRGGARLYRKLPASLRRGAFHVCPSGRLL